MPDWITLITGNVGKAAEYAAMLGIEVTPVRAELTEVQSLDVATLAACKAADACAQLREAVLVDDTGLSVHAWNGFPGALVAWFLGAVGPQGILDMAAGLTDRRATGTTAVGYADATGVRVFTGAVEGFLATEPRGASGFGCSSPASPGQPTAIRCPAVGGPGRTQPPCKRDRTRRRQSPSAPGIRPGCGRPRPSLPGTPTSGARCRRPCGDLGPALNRVRTEVPSGLAPRTPAAAGTATWKHIARCPAHPWPAVGALGRQPQRRSAMGVPFTSRLH